MDFIPWCAGAVSQRCSGGMNYIFVDEIQHVEGFERAVDSLFLRESCEKQI